MTTRHRKKKKKTLLFTLLIALGLIVAAYGYGVFHYQNRFLPNTSVKSQEIGNEEIATANEQIKKSIPTELFTFTENGQTFKTVTLADLGKTPDFTSELNKLMKKQNAWSFPLAFFQNHSTSVGDLTATDEELAAYVETVTPEFTALNEGRTDTTDATLVFADGTFTIQPEVQGTKIDTTKILTDFTTSIKDGQTTLEMADYTTKPTVTKDDTTLQTQLASAEKIAGISANYTINENSFTIPTETIQSWLTFSDGAVNLDQEKVKSYLQNIATQYNTSSVPYTFNSTKRGQVSVPAGSYGWSIQVETETQALTEAILTGEDFTRTPVVKGSGSATGARVGNTYIEVDMQNQHMWFYKDGALVLETDVVTGKPTSATPAGLFYIWNKESPSVLRGANGDGTNYETPVNYWMPIDWTGVGIHDSSWQPTYGGDWYLAHGSHGCINTPPDVMKKLYEAVSSDTPVLVF
ncbi:L,D-transpeptidase family protein [Enterococcus timonensis]|uniref:L,D-transpeptidase family protein n=1 Tax=Enterococcus timonensis TaxID=1852364 RepID=UPI0008D97EB2|nr:peptidoglycan binding domain-containing protein [Enterococcus timonensis]